MEKSVWVVGLLIALLILAACDKKEDTPEETAVSPQQQTPSVQPLLPADKAMPPSGATPATGPMAADDVALGQRVYDESCRSCHAEGIAGAPKTGDRAAWAERIARGMEALTQNSIEGFTGETGTMPARGGDPSLSDDEVKAAVEYMVLQSQ